MCETSNLTGSIFLTASYATFHSIELAFRGGGTAWLPVGQRLRSGTYIYSSFPDGKGIHPGGGDEW